MDWATETNNVIKSGISVKEIAADTGLAVSSVYDLKNGYTSEPRGMAAVRLFALIQNTKRCAATVSAASTPAKEAA